jgi:hypothetical protein
MACYASTFTYITFLKIRLFLVVT